MRGGACRGGSDGLGGWAKNDKSSPVWSGLKEPGRGMPQPVPCAPPPAPPPPCPGTPAPAAAGSRFRQPPEVRPSKKGSKGERGTVQPTPRDGTAHPGARRKDRSRRGSVAPKEKIKMAPDLAMSIASALKTETVLIISD
ncbi:basic proline-rich protein-like [Trachypithecus francoisi]|uniref:basic proline-rich protein-like n=1 Tax=Trachypithecus francoisi TaxID=54180 RepID=UPI00141BE3D3|nr:basic proline-rich protein-like [Trachypithecus francoisi]